MALPVQPEQYAIDCGVFTPAFIHYILSEKKTPVEVNFHTSKMRTHLLHCLVENELSQFRRSARKIIENVMTKPFSSPYFVTAECLG